ncbi:16S rRNA (guanine(966)-N(2))-methyltransferase RsmD [Ornithinimicrobium murale]|uniref:16S rRNA (guanine(966)-N(2))-methyltransferase RsmD n=1 Tax=Ornithinimicrobium murale TaxID=1050153 RepID=UPI000E0D24B8|nr:16S rRNA (guanine(966)-N(2))-methyltransferase RsmD [Ornithinimicrobium murale]
MTRIIAGRLGGRRLSAPPGVDTRPTTDRVREALFSRVESLLDLDGARVLDLYAGSGALGLEAASRGAGAVVLVESHRRTARLIEANVGQLGLQDTAQVRAETVDRVLQRGPAEPFDLVLLDPPYPLPEEELTNTLGLLVSHGWLTPQALVLIERGARSPDPTLPDGLRAMGPRRYGETVVHYLEPDVQTEDV